MIKIIKSIYLEVASLKSILGGGMNLEMTDIISLLRVVVLVSVLFVWVIRYDNIIKEFKQYELPDWLRDFVGIKNNLCGFDKFFNTRTF